MPRRNATVANAVETLCVSLNVEQLDGPDLSHKVLRVLKTINSVPLRSPLVEQAKFTGTEKLFKRLQTHHRADCLTPDILTAASTALFGPAPGTEALRLLRAEAIMSVAEMQAGVAEIPDSALTETAGSMKAEIESLLTSESSSHVRRVLERAQKAWCAFQAS